MPTLNALVSLLVAAAAAGVSTWLLIRIDRARAVERLSALVVRRALLVVCGLAAGVPSERIWDGVGDEGFLNFMVVLAASVALAILHYRLRTRMPFYQLEIGLLWGAWVVGLHLFREEGAAVYWGVLWFLFSLHGALALYPASRRELRRRRDDQPDQDDTPG